MSITLRRVSRPVLLALAAALIAGCGIGTYNPPPGGARAMPPAKEPPPDAPRAFVFTQPAKAPRPAPAAAAAAPATDPASPVGKTCRVYFKPADPAAAGNAAAGAAMAPVEGVVEQITAEWVVVKGSGQTHWVPRPAVLRIDVPNAP
jgi:hypothetical protein